MDFIEGSISAASGSACSPYQQSSSYNPIPTDGNSLIPRLRNLSSLDPSSKFMYHNLHGGGSISAPVTPPTSSSPTNGTPRPATDWCSSYARLEIPLLPLSTPPSPGHQMWYHGTHASQSGTTSPKFGLVSSNPFGFTVEALTRNGSLMCTPGWSRACSPAVTGAADIIMDRVIPNAFVFGSSSTTDLVKPVRGMFKFLDIVRNGLKSDPLWAFKEQASNVEGPSYISGPHCSLLLCAEMNSR
ncbi:protein BZR1 homolog 3-like [Salvia hispanica]|uniref:protein BZR1 homolog 3-like n=1 Tax=Salvia hispanica TaxID=49212 RepID=UPI0020096373|nr:protein BZR1 homolog 3-like [Salvia hispanica]